MHVVVVMVKVSHDEILLMVRFPHIVVYLIYVATLQLDIELH